MVHDPNAPRAFPQEPFIPGPDAQHDIKPWEQRAGPGAGGGGGGAQPQRPQDATRIYEPTEPGEMARTVDNQIGLAGLKVESKHTTPDSTREVKAETNDELWSKFLSEHLYDTRRVTLEHFHLFEWFPLSPGVFHTPDAAFHRNAAYHMLERSPDGQSYYTPPGKAMMVRGGIGAVRLRPISIRDQDYYFMTASSSAVCHEGFPVLVPRRFYSELKPRMLDEGAVPVQLSGEMRYIPDDDALRLFGNRRDVPLLYLHVEELTQLPNPRSDVTSYEVSVVTTFYGTYQGHLGPYITYATFDPASQSDLEHTVAWIEKFYVTGLYAGKVITDFDEVKVRFPGAVFGLQHVLQGTLNEASVRELLLKLGLETQMAERVQIINNYVNTGGGAYVGGDVRIGQGDFVGRDQRITGEKP